MNALRPCALVPVYNHPHYLTTLVGILRQQQLPLILVDDGSQEDCARLLDSLAKLPNVTLVRHAKNLGKGAAIISGLYAAQGLGFTHALQIDADGQHELGDIPKLLDAAAQSPRAIVSARPVFDASVPRGRLYSRYITHVWVWINTLSLRIPDSMCGFRVYPVADTVVLLAQNSLGPRMSFDTEVLVRYLWSGGDVISIPSPVHYHTNGVSHFRIWEDNLRLSSMHARLFLGMLLRLPRFIYQRGWGRP